MSSFLIVHNQSISTQNNNYLQKEHKILSKELLLHFVDKSTQLVKC